MTPRPLRKPACLLAILLLASAARAQEPTEFETKAADIQGAAVRIWSAVYSPDGKSIAAVSGWDNQGEVGGLAVWDVATEKLRFFVRGTNGVRCVAFSPDGDLIAIGQYDHVVRLVDAKTGQTVVQLNGHTSGVNGLVFSPDSQTLYTVSLDRSVRSWDVQAGTLRKQLGMHDNAIYSVALNSAGTVLATGGADNVVKLWDLRTGREQATLKGHLQPVEGIDFAPDGKTLATASWDGKVGLWSVAKAKLLRTYSSHRGNVNGVAFAPDGKSLLSCGADRTLRRWDVEGGQMNVIADAHAEPMYSVHFSPDGKTLATTSWDKKIKIWNAATNELVTTLERAGKDGDAASSIITVAHSPNGRWIASAHDDLSIRIRDAESGLVKRVITGHEDIVSSLAFSSDSTRLASASYDHLIHLWDITQDNEKPLTTFRGHTNWVFGIQFSPDDKQLVSCGYDKTVRLWDVATGKTVTTWEGHTSAVRSVAFSPDGSLIASAGSDRVIRLWSPGKKESVGRLEGHTAAVRAVVFSPDGKSLASASEDKSVRIWDVDTGKVLATCTQATGFYCLAFSPDGKMLATGGGNWRSREYAQVSLWDARTGKLVRAMDDSRGLSMSVLFSSDGKQIYGRGSQQTTSFWDVASGRKERTDTVSHNVRSMALSADGQRLMMGSSTHDGSLWIINPQSGELVIEMQAHDRLLFGVAFSPAGDTVATASEDGTLKVWTIQPLEPAKED